MMVPQASFGSDVCSCGFSGIASVHGDHASPGAVVEAEAARFCWWKGIEDVSKAL